MTGHDFLTLAARLAAGTSEAEWRSAVSRSYYGAFHVARQLMEELGFRVPHGDQAHSFLWLRISNSADPQAQQAGIDLNSLRRLRNQADYDLQRALLSKIATPQVRLGERIIQTLDLARQEPTRTRITDAMKVYERDVLKLVTWHP